jgi:hypothetical protein
LRSLLQREEQGTVITDEAALVEVLARLGHGGVEHPEKRLSVS